SLSRPGKTARRDLARLVSDAGRSLTPPPDVGARDLYGHATLSFSLLPRMASNEPRYDFAVAYEGLFHRGLGSSLTPRLKARLRAAGLDLDRPFEPAYPADRWPIFLRMTAEELFPAVPIGDALRKMGERFFLGYVETLVGKAMLAAMRVIGPMRSLGR